MRFLLTMMAMALFAISVGCDAPPAETTEPATEPAAAAPADGDADHADGDHAEDGDGASAAANSETQTVSLKLPGMTWGGCVASVKSALEGVEGITGIELDGSKTCGKFTAPAGLDVEATLNKLVEGGNKHIKGWSNAE